MLKVCELKHPSGNFLNKKSLSTHQTSNILILCVLLTSPLLMKILYGIMVASYISLPLNCYNQQQLHSSFPSVLIMIS